MVTNAQYEYSLYIPMVIIINMSSLYTNGYNALEDGN